MTAPTDPSDALLDSLQARWAARLAAGLNERAAAVPHDIAERLRISRQQALLRARQRRLALAAASSVMTTGSSGSAASLGHGGGLWVTLASWLPLAVLITGLVLIQQWTNQEQVMAAAEIDAVLLADDLPPAAWTDPGFREYLKAPPP
jgi:hypothetical protein